MGLQWSKKWLISCNHRGTNLQKKSCWFLFGQLTEKIIFGFEISFFVHSLVWKKNTKQFKFVSLVHFWKANFTEVQSDTRSAWTDLNPEVELCKGLFSYLAHATSQWNKRHLILPYIITTLLARKWQRRWSWSFLQFNLPCSVGVPLKKPALFWGIFGIFSRIFFGKTRLFWCTSWPLWGKS